MGIALLRNRTYILLGICIYAGFLVATLPAALLNSITDGAVRFANTQGTLWHGTATIGIYGKAAGEISWKITAYEILLGKLHAEVTEQGEPGPTDVMLSSSGLELKHVSLTLPAAIMSVLGKQMHAIETGGELHAKAEDFVLSKASKGEMVIEWTNASSPLSHVNPLGTYRIHVKGSGTGLEIALETLHGELSLQGNGSWTERGGMRFSGTGESKNEGISELLRITGNPVGPGRYALKVP